MKHNLHKKNMVYIRNNACCFKHVIKLVDLNVIPESVSEGLLREIPERMPERIPEGIGRHF